MVNVQTEIHIRAPRTDVAAYASSPDNAPAWYRNISTARWLSEPPLHAGSLLAFSARFLGRTLDYSYEIVELVPGNGSSCAPPKVRFPCKPRTRGRTAAAAHS